jgi:hypothetical protein
MASLEAHLEKIMELDMEKGLEEVVKIDMKVSMEEDLEADLDVALVRLFFFRYGHGGKPGEVLEVDTAVCTEKVLKVT